MDKATAVFIAKQALSQLSISETEIDTLSEKFAEQAIHVPSESDSLIIGAEHDALLGDLVQFNLVAAMSFLAGLSASVISSDHPVLLALTGLSSLAALQELTRSVDKAEALLLSIIYAEAGRTIQRAVAAEIFSQLSQEHPEIHKDDFAPALNDLRDLGCIEIHGDEIKLVERILVFRGFN